MSSLLNKFHRTHFLIAGILLFLAVAIGAFGAHGLESKVSEQAMRTFQTGSRYHFYHGIGLLFLILIDHLFSLKLKGAIIAFIAGIFLFSFNCYLYAITGIKFFAYLVPLGGVSFLFGWLIFIWRLIRSTP